MMELIAVTLGATLLATALVPLCLPYLRKLKFGQFVREDGPKSHLKKTGTPTMGGLIFMAVILMIGSIMAIETPAILPVLLVSVGFGLVGFIDDYIKVVKKQSLGLKAYQKLLAQLMITVVFLVYQYSTVSEVATLIVPFIQDGFLDLGWFYIPFILIFVLGTVNGVNLTDGIDGLATSVTIGVLCFFLVIDLMIGSNLAPLLVTAIGALLGFLIYNSHPATLFMGDTGSLALGGLVAATAIHMKLPIIILFVGMVYLIEVISVMLQVAYYKKTKKRLFKMAPIHHHFELMGWKETKIVYVFTIFTIIMCLVSVIGIIVHIGLGS
ncbi:phospho-N-acetylmuramoyl-pentapeptide-transferase [Petrocella sp. FN5]|uniref:phospho-N-acetylmuramoyl-pentapeptide- transferase n=1 Tax=Petrocella sp. FN5 TaxID=3032002 RepID=UPI0023DAD519|nr:phospho-N-acetylmuramoyl-pentapeptide-transferase [Petrocella sp. FN5]MDF1616844.1 phospho-N-acetylmuramoyl-pentapeptide-transferase [Petrocella sp. FN5]